MESVDGLLMSSLGKWVTAGRRGMWFTCWRGAWCASGGCAESRRLVSLSLGKRQYERDGDAFFLGHWPLLILGCCEQAFLFEQPFRQEEWKATEWGLFWNIGQKKHLLLNTLMFRYYLSGSSAPHCFALPLNCKKDHQHISPVSY